MTPVRRGRDANNGWTQAKPLLSGLCLPYMTAPASVSLPCVPVSTTATDGPKDETLDRLERASECALAIQTLIEFGWIVGCDGELLPPRWVRRARG